MSGKSTSVEDDVIAIPSLAASQTLSTNLGVLRAGPVLRERACLQAAEKGCAARVPVARANRALHLLPSPPASLWRRRLLQANVPQPRIWEPHGQSQMNGNQRLGAQSLSAGAGLKTNERTEGERNSSNYCELLKTQKKSLLFHRVPFAACNFISPHLLLLLCSGRCQNNLIYK